MPHCNSNDIVLSRRGISFLNVLKWQRGQQRSWPACNFRPVNLLLKLSPICTKKLLANLSALQKFAGNRLQTKYIHCLVFWLVTRFCCAIILFEVFFGASHLCTIWPYIFHCQLSSNCWNDLLDWIWCAWLFAWNMYWIDWSYETMLTLMYILNILFMKSAFLWWLFFYMFCEFNCANMLNAFWFENGKCFCNASVFFTLIFKIVLSTSPCLREIILENQFVVI